MKRGLCIGLCACALAAQAGPLDEAILSGRTQDAWTLLLQASPGPGSGMVARRQWEQTLSAMLSVQCGKDWPVVVPDWAPALSLVLLQRDQPLSRIYRAEVRAAPGPGPLHVQLDAPDGRRLIDGDARVESGDDRQSVVSGDLSQAFPAGAYRLQLRAGARSWQALLPLVRSGDLDWVRRENGRFVLQSPVVPGVCPPVRTEAALFARPSFSQRWSAALAGTGRVAWPALPGADWAALTVTRTELRGNMLLRIQHRQAGPRSEF